MMPLKKCPDCGREIPDWWAVPFTTRWGHDPKTNRFRAYRGLYGKDFADCEACCDRPLDVQDLALIGVTWGGLRRTSDRSTANE